MTQRRLHRCAALQAPAHSPIIYTFQAAHFLQRKLLSAPPHRDCSASVGNLLAIGCPSTIRGFVIPVVVDPVNAQPFRGLSHIGNEVIVAFAPSLANINPARAIALPACGRRPSAAGNHTSIDSIRSVRRVVPRVRIASGWLPPARVTSAASRRSSPQQMGQTHDTHGPASAPALDQADMALSVGPNNWRKFASHSPLPVNSADFNGNSVGPRHRVHHTIAVTRVQAAKEGVVVLKAPAK